MARPPLFQSESTRVRVIGMVMTLLLAISLLMAMGFSRHYSQARPHHVSGSEHWITIGQHAFAIPQGWEVDTRDPQWPLDTSHVSIRHTQSPLQRMIFSTLPDMGMCSPEAALGRASKLFFGKREIKPLHEQSFRQSSFAGRVMMAHVRPQTGRPAMRHILAVYTQDGRYYQLIHYMAVVDASIIANEDVREIEDVSALALVLHMARQSANDRFVKADATARSRAMLALPPSRHQGDEPQSSTTNRWLLGQADHWNENTWALTILPTAGNEGYWQARVLGGPAAPNTADNETDAWLSTEAQLEALGMQAADDDDDAPRYRITQMQSLAIRGWHVSFEAQQDASPSRDGLVRENWYIPDRWLRQNISQGEQSHAADNADGVLLVELLAAPDALAQARASLVSAIKAMHLIPQLPADDSQNASWQAMFVQGKSMAQALGSELSDKLRLGRDYSLFFVDSHPAGFALHHTRKDDGPLPLRGEMVFFQLAQPNRIHTENWATSADSQRMWLASTSLQRRARADAQPVVLSAKRYQLADGNMSQRTLPAAPGASPSDEKIQWQVPAPPNLIPWVMADHVDPALLEAWATTAGGIVWRSVSNQPPAAHVLRVHRVDDQDNPAIAWRLSMRLLASPREDVYFLDEQGWMSQHHWHIVHHAQGSPTQLSAVRTNRETIVKAFDRWLPDIIAWETRTDSNDQESKP